MTTRWAAVRPSGRVAVRLGALATAAALGFGIAGRGENQPARPPAWISNPSARPPEVRTVDGVRHIVSPDAPGQLQIDSIPPRGAARVLWYQGRATQPLGDGTVVVDSAGTLLTFGPRLVPGRPAAEIGTRVLTSAAGGADGSLWVADAEGTVLRLDGRGTPVVETRSPFAAPALGSDPLGEGVWVTRSTTRFEFLFDTTPGPIVARLGDQGRLIARIGKAETPPHALLRELANAGHLAITRDQVFFAPFIRDQVMAFDRSGDPLWVASRRLPQSTVEPRFEVEEGRPAIGYHPVNLGLTIGPDGNLYVLSTPGFTMTASRLDVFDPQSGRLLRSAELATPFPTLAGDAEGRIYQVDPVRLLSGTAPGDRPLAPDVTLPLLDGGRVVLREQRGRVVLINLWASWCLPCREEMPALDSLRRRVRGNDFVFLALSEDHDIDAARRFVAQFGSDFPVPLGGGRMRPHFHYPGLPFTVLLDRAGRVARTWIGYAGPDQIRMMEALIRAELAAGAEPRHHHGAGAAPQDRGPGPIRGA